VRAHVSARELDRQKRTLPSEASTVVQQPTAMPAARGASVAARHRNSAPWSQLYRELKPSGFNVDNAALTVDSVDAAAGRGLSTSATKTSSSAAAPMPLQRSAVSGRSRVVPLFAHAGALEARRCGARACCCSRWAARVRLPTRASCATAREPLPAFLAWTMCALGCAGRKLTQARAGPGQCDWAGRHRGADLRRSSHSVHARPHLPRRSAREG